MSSHFVTFRSPARCPDQVSPACFSEKRRPRVVMPSSPDPSPCLLLSAVSVLRHRSLISGVPLPPRSHLLRRRARFARAPRGPSPPAFSRRHLQALKAVLVQSSASKAWFPPAPTRTRRPPALQGKRVTASPRRPEHEVVLGLLSWRHGRLCRSASLIRSAPSGAIPSNLAPKCCDRDVRHPRATSGWRREPHLRSASESGRRARLPNGSISRRTRYCPPANDQAGSSPHPRSRAHP